jgi:hypothetical protein
MVRYQMATSNGKTLNIMKYQGAIQPPKLQSDHSVHVTQREVLLRHPKLSIRFSQVTADSHSEDEELALMNVPEDNIIPAFLTVTASESEPFEPLQAARDQALEREILA